MLAQATGCNRSSAPDTVQVRGHVTLAGKPVTAGTVMFEPLEVAEGLPKRPATGALQPDGTYELSSFAAGDGALPGKYKVAIISFTGGPTPEEPNRPERWNIPKKYGSTATSGLTQDVPVEADEPLVIDFELTQ